MAKSRRRSRDEIWGTLRRGSLYLLPHRFKLGLVFVLVVLVSLFSLIFPKLVGGVIDFSTKPNGWIHVRPLLEIYALVIVLRAVCLLSRNHLLQTTGMLVTCDLRFAVFSHLQKLSIRFYEERQTGRVVARITEDAGAVHQVITQASVSLLGELTTSLGVVVMLFYLNWRLALVSILIVPCFVINYRFHRRRMRFESRRHSRHWYRVLGFLNERIAHNRVVRAFATENEEEAFFRLGLDRDYTNFNQLQWRNTLMLAVAEFLSGLGTLATLAYGSWLITQGSFTTGNLFAFLGYITLLYGPIVRVVEANLSIQKGVTALEKIFALLDTKPHIPDNEALPEFPRIRGKVEFRDVSFGYRLGQSTLDHVSFIVEPGEMIALVGPSGAGKSTIITLLSRFYDPTGGRILIDDQPAIDYNVQSVRRQVGIVMQDNILFSGTIIQNIRYGRPDALDSEVFAAARAANADEFILGLAHGYDSVVGERGVSLSGGQRQRIAIARVLLKDPRILILDEATSALDSQAEKLIQEATEKLMRNRTAIVIAHRLSTVVNANRILVMDKGSIIDVGSHVELLARPGLYRDLYQIQFAERARA